jgi:hypothetical protein
MVLPTILLVVIFIIRQVKFNSKRVHLSLPHKYSFLVFLYFFGLFFAITALPFIGNLTAYVKANYTLDTKQYEIDKKIMAEGFAHFYLEKQYIDDPTDCAEAERNGFYEDDYGDRIGYTRYELNETQDSLIFYRDYVQYSYDDGLDTISLNQAYAEIDAFIAISDKYQGGVTKTNPVAIVALNLTTDRFYNRLEKNARPAFNHIADYKAFDNNTRFHERLIDKDSVFHQANIDFWKGYFFVALVLAALLLMLCSVHIAEFGWGMLVIALHPTVFGIVGALLAYLMKGADSQDAAYVGIALLLLFTLNAYFFAFSKRFKPVLKRAFAITCHFYTPIVAVLILVMFKEATDCCFQNVENPDYCDCFLPFSRDQYNMLILCVLGFGTVITTFFFGRYYKKQYINPEIK